MKKRKKIAQLSMVSGQRKALLKSLAVGLIENGRIKTTLVKAKALRGLIEKKISIAKKGLVLENKLAKTRVLRKFFSQKTVEKLFVWGEIFKNRSGGYCRIIKLPFRQSDSASMAVIEMVEMPKVEEKSKDVKKGFKKENKKVEDIDKKKKMIKEKKAEVLKAKKDKIDEK